MVLLMEAEQRELNNKLCNILTKAAEEVAQQFGERYKVGFFRYEGCAFGLTRFEDNPPRDVFYFQKTHKKFINFAQDFLGMLTFPINRALFPKGCGEDTVQVSANFLINELPIVADIRDRKYEPIIRKHLNEFALQNNKNIEYSNL